jgi:hypothetical protein
VGCGGGRERLDQLPETEATAVPLAVGACDCVCAQT